MKGLLCDMGVRLWAGQSARPDSPAVRVPGGQQPPGLLLLGLRKWKPCVPTLEVGRPWPKER